MLSEDVRKDKRVCALARRCWADNQSYIVLYQASWVRCINGCGNGRSSRCKSLNYKNECDTVVMT